MFCRTEITMRERFWISLNGTTVNNHKGTYMFYILEVPIGVENMTIQCIQIYIFTYLFLCFQVCADKYLSNADRTKASK